MLIAAGFGAAASADPLAVNTNRPIATTPPMGFNNWARFQCLPQAPLNGRDAATYGFQDFMLDQGAALVATGLAQAGYRMVVVDDCWMERGGDGQLHGIGHWGSYKHPSRQPGFGPDLTGYMAALHRMGLEGGLYNTSGKSTCQLVAAGEEGHQDEDAARFAAWGVDFLKLDNCGASDAELPALFRQMAEALGRATAHGPRKILFDESAPAQYAPTDPMKYQSMAWVRPLGQMWRVAPDIRITHVGPNGRSLYDPWSFNDAAQGYEEGVYQAYTDTVALSRYVAAGDWNDADQLLIGDDGLTTAEERSQMGLWSIMGAPLIISADVRELARNPSDPHFAASLAILRNARAIAIDQDALGAGGYRVLRDNSADDTGVDIALKPLADGGFAFLVLNKNPIPIDYALPLSRLGVTPTPCALTLTDVWSGQTRVIDARDAVSGHIEPHDNMMFRVAPAACARLTPTGQITAAQAAFATPPLCLEARGDGVVTTQSCSGGARQQWSMEPSGRIRQATTSTCLAADARGGPARTAACDEGPSQHFAYHRSGALVSGAGLCLGVETAKVGNGGLIGQQGARLQAERCGPYAPDQIFSAPRLGSPMV
ncbi:MAG: ricin-type beta-trefoil lectin domain protein [Pseudomonadota bacterium]|nr:ricin-type beta-trefoil lectin domain protein [Pseudomonadota bacterium]